MTRRVKLSLSQRRLSNKKIKIIRKQQQQQLFLFQNFFFLLKFKLHLKTVCFPFYKSLSRHINLSNFAVQRLYIPKANFARAKLIGSSCATTAALLRAQSIERSDDDDTFQPLVIFSFSAGKIISWWIKKNAHFFFRSVKDETKEMLLARDRKRAFF